MTFEEALPLLKTGMTCMRRSGWNGKGQHVYLEDGYIQKIRVGPFSGTVREYLPTLCLYNAQEKHQPGWLPSMGDLMATDWEEVPR